jgi:hypothetical protein
MLDVKENSMENKSGCVPSKGLILITFIGGLDWEHAISSRQGK